ncbi:MAG: hypothetical protein PHP03_01500 [Candidatus Pacebacteria bacterium]|nr:hypothetical protein [Candidatus Paceibacterota bacterium]
MPETARTAEKITVFETELNEFDLKSIFFESHEPPFLEVTETQPGTFIVLKRRDFVKEEMLIEVENHEIRALDPKTEKFVEGLLSEIGLPFNKTQTDGPSPF